MIRGLLLTCLLFFCVCQFSVWAGDRKDFAYYYQVGDWKKAVDAYLASSTRNAPAEIGRLAAAYYHLGRLDAAETEAHKALAGEDSRETQVLLELIRARRGGKDKSLQNLQALLTGGRDDSVVLTAMGIIWTKSDAAKALSYYRQAIERNDDNFLAWFSAGLLYEDEEQFEKAIRVYKNAVRINPLFAQAHNNLGYAYKEMGFYLYAIQEYQKAIDLRPDNAGYHYNIGNALTHEERLNEAFQSYQRAVEIDPTFAKAHYNLGRTYLRWDMVQEAIEELKLYVKYGTKAVFSYVASKSAVEEEIEELELYLRNNPDEKPGKRGLAR